MWGVDPTPSALAGAPFRDFSDASRRRSARSFARPSVGKATAGACWEPREARDGVLARDLLALGDGGAMNSAQAGTKALPGLPRGEAHDRSRFESVRRRVFDD